MNAYKSTIAVAVLFVAGIVAPPAQAHLKRRPSFVSTPRWVSVRHSHAESDISKTKADGTKFDPVKGAVDVVRGTLDMIGKTIGAIFGGGAEDGSQRKKAASHKSDARRYEYRLVHNHPSDFPMYLPVRGR